MAGRDFPSPPSLHIGHRFAHPGPHHTTPPVPTPRYSRVYSDPAEMPEFCSHYFAHYRSRLEWNGLLARAGLVQSPTSPDCDANAGRFLRPVPLTERRWIKNPFRYYYGCWQRPQS